MRRVLYFGGQAAADFAADRVRDRSRRKRRGVLSISRHVDSLQPGSDICSSLALTKADVITYFALAQRLDAVAFHDEALIFPCSYKGSLRISGHRYRWQIFAGGTAYLYDGAGVNARYLCREKCLDALPDLR